MPPRNLWSIHFIFMSKPTSDSFDSLSFGSLENSGISYEQIEALAKSARSERVPAVAYSETGNCFRIQYNDMIVFSCGSIDTAWKIINLVILDMI